MTIKRMDNVGIVVEDLDAAIEFFAELGLELEGRAPIEGAWADGVTGLRNQRVSGSRLPGAMAGGREPRAREGCEGAWVASLATGRQPVG